jgi:aspartyl-tRNA(Asn)/glutamyl-tRNA(Gln) amidotransferase subunit A
MRFRHHLLPATTPLISGLPIGLQIVGAPFAETTVLALAHGYEQETEMHRKHPKLKPV